MQVVPSFSDLKKALKLINPDFKKIRIAVLGDSATQLICTALKGMAKLEGIELDLYEAEYDQLKQEIIDTESPFYQFKPEFVLLFHSTQKLSKSFYKKELSKKETFANNWIDDIAYFLDVLNQQLNTNILFLNFVESDDAIFGNYGLKTRASFNYNVKSINYKLMEMSHLMKNLFVVDLNNLASKFGNQNIADPKIYITTDTIFSIEFIPQLAKLILDVLLPFTGKFKKCVILDLDNTTWGGIIGDDGIENIQIGDLGIGKAFTEFQYWIKQLKERGIILAVCSKNTEHIAKEPFEKHPDMVLRLDDISVFVANWENKADNIRYIQSILNIGFDSMVFLDDNPFERNIVRENIPQICVPELPEDPAEYLPYLKSQALFETISFTHEDLERTKLYQEEANRTVLQHKFTNEEEFLQNLEMSCIVEPITKFTMPRVAQLSQRSNQFNLRTIRYSDEAIQAIMDSNNYFSLTFTLKDKYGDYGLISEIIMENKNDTLFIETWIMSCRVLKRNVENFVLNNIVQIGRENGFSKIVGEYIPTAKNAMVADHYKNLGFEEDGNGFWILEIKEYQERKNYIEKR